jgi:hypothetical protein
VDPNTCPVSPRQGPAKCESRGVDAGLLLFVGTAGSCFGGTPARRRRFVVVADRSWSWRATVSSRSLIALALGACVGLGLWHWAWKCFRSPAGIWIELACASGRPSG